MNIVLLIILLLLMLYIDIKRGIKLFISIIINFIILIILFYLIAIGINPIICSIIGCLIVSYIVLYFVNGENLKTKASFKSIIIVLIILSISIFIITKLSRTAGFEYELDEDISIFSTSVNIDFIDISVALVLFSLIGATIDTSVAISSALYEVYENNKNLKEKELFKSGMNIGHDILCTTTNTLLFVFLGDFLTLFIWYYKGHYSLLEIMNAKTFAGEVIKILFSALGCIIIIPITSYITTKNIKKIKNKSIKLEE